MSFKIALIFIVGLLVCSSTAWAQQDSTQAAAPRPKPAIHRLDIIPMIGYVWTVSQDGTYGGSGGDLDFENSEFWGLAVDINAHPAAQLRLLYRRQDTKLTFKSGGVTEDLGDLDVEYWHIGAVKGITKGKVKPFSGVTLGGTRYVYDGGDDWKFSAILGVGAKIYLNEKIGIMVAGNMPFTFTDAFLGLGTGGLSVGGTGIVQFDLGAGLVIAL